MIDMMITTNIRMTKEDWMQAKSIASEMGMSFNGYVNWLMRDLGRKKELLGNVKIEKKVNKKMSFADIALSKVVNDKPMGLNKDDEVIYG